MKTNFTIRKAVIAAFTMLVSAAVVLVGEVSVAGVDSLQRYHVLLAEKYGYQVFEVSVTRVTNPDRVETIRQASETTRHRLVDFASSIGADAFAYQSSGIFWRISKGNRILGYTYSIDILKNDVKQYDYYCFALVEYRGNEGFTVGCAAYAFSEV